MLTGALLPWLSLIGGVACLVSAFNPDIGLKGLNEGSLVDTLLWIALGGFILFSAGFLGCSLRYRALYLRMLELERQAFLAATTLEQERPRISL